MCELKGWIFHEGQNTHKWFGKWMGDSPLPAGIQIHEIGRCTHAIEIPGCAYEIGVYMRPDGPKLFFDYWKSGGLDVALGQDGSVLTQSYDVAKTVCWAEENQYEWTLDNMLGGTKVTITNEYGGTW